MRAPMTASRLFAIERALAPVPDLGSMQLQFPRDMRDRAIQELIQEIYRLRPELLAPAQALYRRWREGPAFVLAFYHEYGVSPSAPAPQRGA